MIDRNVSLVQRLLHYGYRCPKKNSNPMFSISCLYSFFVMNFDLWLASMVCAKKRARHSNGHTSTLIYLDSKLSSQKCQIMTSRSTMGKKVGQFWFRSLSGCMLRGAGVGKPSFFCHFLLRC